jgi:hypothetical protein
MRTATTATTTALAVTAAPGSSTPSDVRQYARSAFGIRQTEAIGDHGTSCTIRPALWILQRKHQREKRSYGHVKADPPPAPSTAAPATIGQTEILATIVHNLLVLRTLRDMPTRLLSWPQHTVRFAAASPGRRLLVEELNTWRAERKPANIDEFVFATANGRPRDKDSVRERLLAPVVNRTNEIRAERGIAPLPKITPHALRRTYISLMLEAGAPLPYVMDQVGHADSKTTLEIYAQVQKRISRKNVHAAFDELLNGADRHTLSGPHRAALRSGTRRAGPAAARRSGTSRRGQRDHAPSRRASTELKRSQDVVALQVRVVGEDLVDCHARGEQLQHALNRVAQPSDRRLPVADGWVGRDAVESGHALTIPPRRDAQGSAQRPVHWAVGAHLGHALGHGGRSEVASNHQQPRNPCKSVMGTAGLEPATSRV